MADFDSLYNFYSREMFGVRERLMEPKYNQPLIDRAGGPKHRCLGDFFDYGEYSLSENFTKALLTVV